MLAGVMSLDSCYYSNTSGHIWQQAAYESCVNISHARIGDSIYVVNSSYYIALPHCRYGKDLKYIVNRNAPEDTTKRPHKTDKKDIVEIPEDFAMYLAGASTSPQKPSWVSTAKDPSIINKATKVYKVTQTTPISFNFTAPYTSPNAGTLYTLAIFDFLLVDIPLTVAFNCGIAALYGAAAYADSMSD